MSEETKNVALRAGGLMAFALLMSRILGMLRDTAMGAQFGINLETDAYRIALQLPDLVFLLVAGGGLSSAFIPIFSDLWYKDRRDEAWKTFSSVVWLTGIAAVALIGVAWGLTPTVVEFFRDGKPVETAGPAIEMARIMLPAQFAFLVGSVLLGTLYARKQFLGPAISPNVYNVGIIIGATLLPAFLGTGIEGMAWGALVGAFVGNILLPVILMARAGSRFHFGIDLHDAGVRRFGVLLLPILLGFSLPSMVNIITQRYASALGQAGTNTVLAFANNLMQAPLGIFGQSLALAAFPVLAEHVARNRMDLYRDQVAKTLRTVLYLALPASGLLAALAPEIVDALYGYGRATQTPDQLANVALSLRIYCVAIFAWCLQPVLMRGFFSLQDSFQPIAIGTVMTGIFIGGCEVLVQRGAHFTAIPWITNGAAILLMIGLHAALARRVGSLDAVGLLMVGAQSLAATAVSSAAAFGLARLWNPSHQVLGIAWLTLLLLVAIWTYYFVTRALKMEESAYLSRAFARLERRRRDPNTPGSPAEN